MFYVKTFLGLIKKQKQKQQNNTTVEKLGFYLKKKLFKILFD